jgi:hypothetical protein
MIAAVDCVRLNTVKVPVFGWDLHCSPNGTRQAKIGRHQDPSDLILHFRLNIFLPLSEPSFPLNICADCSHLRLNHHLSPEATQSLLYALIFGDPKSPRFFLSHRLTQVLKSPGNTEHSLCFHLIPAPPWPLVTFSLTFYNPL